MYAVVVFALALWSLSVRDRVTGKTAPLMYCCENRMPYAQSKLTDFNIAHLIMHLSRMYKKLCQ